MFSICNEKLFPTFVDEKCKDVETIVVSAGKVGHQVEVKPEVLEELVGAQINRHWQHNIYEY